MSSTSRAAIPAINETSTSCPRPGVMARHASEQRLHVAALVGIVRCTHLAAAAACTLLTGAPVAAMMLCWLALPERALGQTWTGTMGNVNFVQSVGIGYADWNNSANWSGGVPNSTARRHLAELEALVSLFLRRPKWEPSNLLVLQLADTRSRVIPIRRLAPLSKVLCLVVLCPTLHVHAHHVHEVSVGRQ